MSNKTRHKFAVTLIVAALTLGALGIAGCGEAGDPTDTTAGPPDGSIVHPSGANEIVLQVSSGGGFVPVSWALTQVPEFTLYGDGTAIVTGPVIAIYPGPALPNLQTSRVSEKTMQAILSAAREAGLFASDVDYGQPQITDVPATVITVNAEGTTYLSNIYALGAEENAGGLSLEQQQARAAVSSLIGKLLDLTPFETGLQWSAYDYSSLAVFSVPVDPNIEPNPDDVQPNRLEWPLGDLATLGEAAQPDGYRRIVVSGDDLATLQPVLKEANQITIWTVGDREYNLYFRPLLPDEA
ncbi:MAG: hypothetical protein JW990_09760 [Thermoleophilia bacterium]|nr:hypothetical protein [Thermoleophilia bacterium]